MTNKQQKALTEAIDWINLNHECTAIVASGSIIRGNGDENSDFDFYVVHSKPFRQRIQKYFNGVPCEIFLNNIDHIYDYFETEGKNNRPVTAHILLTGQVVKGKDDPQIKALIEEAKTLATKFTPLTAEQLIAKQYTIALLFEDAMDVKDSDVITAAFILDKAVLEAVDFIFLKNQLPLPRLKERFNVLDEIEPAAAKIARQYYDTTINNKFDIARKLVLLTAKHTGFFEWESSKI